MTSLASAGRPDPAPARDLPLTLARLHRGFERIHPFIDGNDRVGRLALNLIQIRLVWPPAIIDKRARDRYLTALDLADHADLGPLAELIARSVLENLQRLVVPSIAGPARLVPLQSLAGQHISYHRPPASSHPRTVRSRNRIRRHLANQQTSRRHLPRRTPPPRTPTLTRQKPQHASSGGPRPCGVPRA